jgi:hypothetical protein
MFLDVRLSVYLKHASHSYNMFIISQKLYFFLLKFCLEDWFLREKMVAFLFDDNNPFKWFIIFPPNEFLGRAAQMNQCRSRRKRTQTTFTQILSEK